MTEISDAGRKLAAEWVGERRWKTLLLEARERLAQAATDYLALKAEHEKAVADARAAYDLLDAAWGLDRLDKRVRADIEAAHDRLAKYRETDPLVEAITALGDGRAGGTPESYAACLRAELSKRGVELARVKP